MSVYFYREASLLERSARVVTMPTLSHSPFPTHYRTIIIARSRNNSPCRVTSHVFPPLYLIRQNFPEISLDRRRTSLFPLLLFFFFATLKLQATFYSEGRSIGLAWIICLPVPERRLFAQCRVPMCFFFSFFFRFIVIADHYRGPQAW